MEISFAFQLRAEHHSVGCQILDRVVTHQHMDSFFLCSTGVSVWPWCWTVAWSFTSSSIHITFSCRTWAYDDQNGVSCLVSTFLKKSYWEIFKLNWKRHAIRYFSFLAVKMTHPPLSLTISFSILCTLGIFLCINSIQKKWYILFVTKITIINTDYRTVEF